METFLSFCLFISRPRPTASASKMRPRLQKTFPRFPFFYFGNFGQISNQTWTNFSSDVVSTKIETKYYFFNVLMFQCALCVSEIMRNIEKKRYYIYMYIHDVVIMGVAGLINHKSAPSLENISLVKTLPFSPQA